MRCVVCSKSTTGELCNGCSNRIDTAVRELIGKKQGRIGKWLKGRHGK